MNADGGHARHVTPWRADDYAPSFSPDGRKIVFAHRSKSGNSVAIYLVNSDGTHFHRLVRDAWSPDYSPDGRRIVFERVENGARYPNAGIFVMHSDGSHVRQLTRTPYSRPDPAGFREALYFDQTPRFSPDGKRIVFVRQGGWTGVGAGGDICVVDASGKHFRDLTPPFEYVNSYADPTFSPDGRLILFVRVGYHRSLLVMRGDGTHRRVILTRKAPYVQFDGRVVKHPDDTYAQPDWQPLPR